MKTRLKKGVRTLASPAYLYQTRRQYLAQISEEIKDQGKAELEKLGATDMQPIFRGIRFSADPATLYRINYQARLISRVLAPLTSFDCDHPDTIYHHAKTISWKHFFLKNRTFAVSADISESDLNHSQYAALRLKDGIVDYFLEKTGRPRPNVDKLSPDIHLHLYIRKNQAVLSLDTSGAALHKRGYREESVAAPIQETLAAGILHLAGWDGTTPLYDPFCGSGTFLCEALMQAARIPAGIFREQFGFEILPDFDPETWREVKQAADRQITEPPRALIAGSDLDHQAVQAARTNLMGLHFGAQVEVSQQDFRDLAGLKNTLIVANPPYGIRLGDKKKLPRLYRDLGDFLKQKCGGATAYVYMGDRAYIKNMGLKPTWKYPLLSGGLDGRLVRYDLY